MGWLSIFGNLYDFLRGFFVGGGSRGVLWLEFFDMPLRTTPRSVIFRLCSQQCANFKEFPFNHHNL